MEKFSSRLLSKHVTRTNALESLVISGWVRGLSDRDIEAALRESLGDDATIGKPTGSRICEAIKTEFDTWRTRDLSEVAIDYLLDASHFTMHDGARSEPVLVAYGITTEGRSVLVHLDGINAESTDAFVGFLEDMVARGWVHQCWPSPTALGGCVPRSTRSSPGPPATVPDPPVSELPCEVWQLDFSEFETLAGGTWRIAGCADYFAKHEFGGWRISPTENHHDAIAAIEQAIDDVETLLGHSLLADVTDADGIPHPVKVVTDNGPAFEAIRFARFIDSRTELVHIRTRRKSPHTNGVRERAFGSLKYEHLYRWLRWVGGSTNASRRALAHWRRSAW